MGQCCCMSNTQQEIHQDILMQKCKKHSELLNNSTVTAYVQRVIDGDTVICNLFIDNDNTMPLEFSVRLSNLDAPEIHSHNVIEKKHAVCCKQFVYNLINNKFVKLECGKLDKYGRMLAIIYFKENGQEKNLNEILLKDTPCNVYTGKTKSPFIFKDISEYSKEYQNIFHKIQDFLKGYNKYF